MSIIRCDPCGNFIDTDEDVESYNEKTDRWLCWRCRDEEEEERE